MSIKVRYGDAEIEATNEADLAVILAAIDRRKSAGGAGNSSVSERLAKLLKMTRPPQQKLLDFLRQHEDWVRAEDICTALSYERRQKIGGVIMALSKKAAPLDLNVDRWVISRKIERDPASGRIYYYKLTPEMREAMEAAG